jgi:hypothetical protein
MTDAHSEKGAFSAFSKAIDSSTNPTEKVVSKIMAGWGHFQLGDDETALELVDDVLELDEDAWVANIVGASVEKNEDEAIRSGGKSVGILLRWVANGTENTSIQAEIGDSRNENEIKWSEVEHLEGHGFLDQVYPETSLKFTLRGKLPDFPSFQAYYLAIGLYNKQMDYIEDIYLRLGTGPNRPDTVESISIEEP